MKKALLIGCGAVAAVGILIAIGCSVLFKKQLDVAQARVEQKRAAAATQQSAPRSESLPSVAGNWVYSTKIDEMRGESSYTAQARTAEPLPLRFPYEGSHGVIILRISPKYGQDAIIGVDRGQILCHDGCTLNLKFDDGPIEKWGFTEAAGGSSDIVFANQYKKFVDRVLVSKKLMVEAEFFDQGTLVMKFDVTGLKWPPPESLSPPAAK